MADDAADISRHRALSYLAPSQAGASPDDDDARKQKNVLALQPQQRSKTKGVRQMGNGHEEEFLPEIVRRFPIIGPDQRDHDRNSAIVTTSANAAALAAHWIASDPNGTSFEATMSVKFREGFFKSRSITTKILIRKF